MWATPTEVIRIAERAAALGGDTAGLLIITAGWTGCRWRELTGLRRDNVDLDRGVLIIDARTGSLHESAHTRWLDAPKTASSARTITLPPFLITMLRSTLNSTTTSSCSPPKAEHGCGAALSSAACSNPRSTATKDDRSQASVPCRSDPD
ncbi:site-specific integrase [Lentzea waywayandensis]|uniref:hypothetical protein n=1 Tax=Lentzea waywayandensis TaxID=84724 RepID=UPI000B89EEF4|nr:hypothetical protein [Lentzea waywayandensis]